MSIIHIFLSVSVIVSSTLSNNKCHFELNNYIRLDFWKKWKDSHDYIINYDNIKTTLATFNKEYNEYPDYIRQIYKRYKQKCCKRYYYMYPRGINFIQWYNNDNPLSELEFNVNNPTFEERNKKMTRKNQNNKIFVLLKPMLILRVIYQTVIQTSTLLF